MVRELIHDPIFLGRRSGEATPADLEIARDLMDTLAFYRESCVGMAANMIGETRRIIAFDNGGSYMLMLNPVILKSWDGYEAQESCLSLLGGPRTAKRYRKIKVQYQNDQFQTRIRSFEGFPAQIIQHEIDHCNGILI